MDQKISAKVSNGMESLIRVMGVLKRKEFSVTDISLNKLDESDYSDLLITLNGETNSVAEQAANLMEKIISVNEIKIFEGEI